VYCDLCSVRRTGKFGIFYVVLILNCTGSFVIFNTFMCLIPRMKGVKKNCSRPFIAIKSRVA